MPRTRRLRAALNPTHPAETAAPCATEVLRVCGELDFLTARQLSARIGAMAEDHQALTVDLTGAWLYDQVAVDALAEARDQARRAGCELVFTHAPAARLARTAAPCGGRRRPRRSRPGRAGKPSTSIARQEKTHVDTALEITNHHDPDGRTVLALRGEVDINTAPRLRTALTKALAHSSGLVLDVAGAVLVDAAGLRVLTAAQRQAAATGKRPITLRGVRPLLAKTLNLTGLDHLFPREPAPAPVLAQRAPAAALARRTPPSQPSQLNQRVLLPHRPQENESRTRVNESGVAVHDLAAA